MAIESSILRHILHCQTVKRCSFLPCQICSQQKGIGNQSQKGKSSLLTPEATFIPTVAGLHPREDQKPEISTQMSLLISEAIAQGIAAGLQQNHQMASTASDITLNQGQHSVPQVPRDLSAFQRPHSPTSSMQIREYLLDDEEHRELMLSEDEGMAPEPPAFTGLFRPALFKTLNTRHKANTTAHIGADPAMSDSALGLSDPNDLLFSEPATGNTEIPSPKLFLDVVQ